MSLEFETTEQNIAWAIIDTELMIATIIIVKLKCIANLQKRSSRKFWIEM